MPAISLHGLSLRVASLQILCGLLLFTTSLSTVSAKDGSSGSMVRFDTSAIAAAHPLSDPSDLSPSLGVSRWCIPFELSAFVASPNAPKIEQIVLEVEVLDPALIVDDYCPRTQTSSPFAGDITFEQSSESNKHVGMNASGSYGPTIHGDVGGDVGQKKIESRKYQRVAPVEIVAAAGTLKRGKGAFFKLRSTPTQVLEGDKAFKIFVRAPQSWRGGLIEVRAVAQATRRGFPGMSDETVVLGNQRFLVAVYEAGDSDSYRFANQLVEAEANLRASAEKYQEVIRRRSDKNVFQQVAAKLDLTPTPIPSDWMQRAIFANVDTHADPAIRRLPVDVRVSLLDYQDARQSFMAHLNSQSLVAERKGNELVAN